MDTFNAALTLMMGTFNEVFNVPPFDRTCPANPINITKQKIGKGTFLMSKTKPEESTTRCGS